MSTKIDPDTLTPMMKQWYACKKQAKDAVLFFRMGDFYEAFYEDAELTSKVLDLTLTKRHNIPMSGVPHHSVEPYIDRLVSKGYKVAIAEQMEDPKMVKGIVKRKIVRTISPGTLVASKLIQDKDYNYICAIVENKKSYGLAFIDCTTTTLHIISLDKRPDLLNELFKIHPSEILCTKAFLKTHSDIFNELRLNYPVAVTHPQEWMENFTFTETFLMQHFCVHTLDGLGFKELPHCTFAAYMVLNFIKETLNTNISHIKDVKRIEIDEVMNLDIITQRNLELIETLSQNSNATLLDLLDHTHTPMGARLLKEWIKRPLLNLEKIQRRQQGTEELTKNTMSLKRLQKYLPAIRDLERLMMKISSSFASPKDFVSLKYSLMQIPKVKYAVQDCTSFLITECGKSFEDTTTLTQFLDGAISDDAPYRISDGGVIKDGYSEELDKLRHLHKTSTSWLTQYQQRLKEELKIKTLKVGYNRVFGYFIEVSRGQSHLMPQGFSKKQTLVNQERFISEELKIFEEKILSAEEKTQQLETRLFEEIRQKVAKHFDLVLDISKALAILDVLASFAHLAIKMDYVRPTITQTTHIDVIESRHPVIEAALIDEPFIPNDCHLDEECKMLLLTGPNMGGKSTYLRQIAHLCILAQMGAFVPAKAATLGLVDKIFTRIGASDDLARRQSTFMVEMAQTANILNNATEKSLIILDEIGRGTSTFDGIAIAQSVLEYLYYKKRAPKTLFATHFFELTKLEKALPKLKNFHVALLEDDTGITFLHKIQAGACDKSYGVHVAKLAGLPEDVIHQAKAILKLLEQKKTPTFHAPQTLFETKIPKEPKWIQELKTLDIENITPLEALQLLHKFKKFL